MVHDNPPDVAPGLRQHGRPGAAPTPLPEDLQTVFADYQADLAAAGTGLNDETIRVYQSRVRQYLAWLATADEIVEGDPFTQVAARDRAARGYREHLQTVAHRKPATINAHLSAVDDFYRRRGLGPALVERAETTLAAPRVLDQRDQIRLLRQADQAPLRDKALTFTSFYAGTRISETTRLDTSDIDLATGPGHLTVRSGDRRRKVPLHPKLRTVLEEWLEERSGRTGAHTNPALFLNQRGGRLSARSAYTVLRAIADAAGLPLGRDGVFTPRVLRDTAGTIMTRQGTDILTVATLLGQSPGTAHRYLPPSHTDQQKAIDQLTTDE